MEQSIKCDSSLLELLQKVDNKHIDYLVDLLTAKGSGRVALSSSIKDLLLEEKNGRDYSKQGLSYLLYELQTYGGHSLANIFRKEPLSYSELLMDVHKKLNGVDSKEKSDLQKEREIVLSLFGNDWQSLDKHERLQRCKETRVVTGFFKMQDHLNTDEKGLAIGLSTAKSAALFLTLRATPVTAIIGTIGLAASKTIGEAYRITIPFIAHIAMLKMLYSLNIDNKKQNQPIQISQMSSSLDNNQLASLRKATADIAIVDADKHTLMQIYTVEEDLDENYLASADGKLNAENISQLNHLLSSLPLGATTIAGNSQHLMTCSFEFSQLLQAKDGKGSLGAVVNPKTKKIAEQARFQEATTLKTMVNVGLIVNLASQVLAQKHLADINDRLKDIKQSLDAIQTHLENKRFSKIQAFRENISIISGMLSAGEEVNKDMLQNLAKTAQEVRAEIIHISKDIINARNEIQSFEPTSLFGSNDLREKLKQKINNLEHFQNEYLVGMQSLLIANLILFIKYDGNKEFVRTSELYLNEINSSSGIISEWENAKKIIHNHLQKMKPKFERTISTNANSVQILRKLERVDSLLQSGKDQITLLNKQIQAAQSPQMIVEVIGGKVVRGHYLN